MKILVVDDSKAMRMIVKRNLGQVPGFENVETIEAASGSEALGLIHAGANPDLIVSDWNMPEMTGIELLMALKAEGSTIPFGFVTSETQPEMRAQGIANGAKFLLAKPFTPDDFVEILSSVAGG